jgi:molybdopterin-guanine dinucleotide biosynthesis protein A
MRTRQTVPPLNGLVLAGGRSSRLARDKGSIDYHGAPQARWAFDLLNGLCERRFVSVRRAQLALPAYRDLPCIVDREPSAGPASGLAAAFEREPGFAWLLVAADMPLLTRGLIERLAAERDARGIVTAFRHADGTPEPLCAIFEPTARVRLAANGPISLRGLIEGGPASLLVPDDETALRSVNTPEEELAVRQALAARAGDTPRGG